MEEWRLHLSSEGQQPDARPRLRDLGYPTGRLPVGPTNSITDVNGVRVGQFTLIQGQDIRTGVTAILPHGGNLFQDKLPAGLSIANGFGKLAGASQLIELGEIETPILLTNTLAVPAAAQAAIFWTLSQPGNEHVVSVNPVVGETNDSQLNDIRSQSITPEMALRAIESAASTPPAEGAVGAGTGVTAFGWKSGIGSSSRQVAIGDEIYLLGALVQANFGGDLHILGNPIGRYLATAVDQSEFTGAGSCMIVLATDAPLSDRNLTRLARRAFAGMARTGASFSNGSGDYALAFSTAESARRTVERRAQPSLFQELPNHLLDQLFLAAAESTEEAIYNSLFCARSMSGYRGALRHALPSDQVLARLRSVHQA